MPPVKFQHDLVYFGRGGKGVADFDTGDVGQIQLFQSIKAAAEGVQPIECMNFVWKVDSDAQAARLRQRPQ